MIELIEGWMDYITGIDNKSTYKDPYASYRMSYPATYKTNMFLTKFERDQFTREFSTTRGSKTTSRTILDYTFVNAFPLSLTAIPVSYEESQVLKCSVSFNFIRYVMERKSSLVSSGDAQLFDSGNVNTTRNMIVNRDPTIGANELLGATQTFA